MYQLFSKTLMIGIFLNTVYLSSGFSVPPATPLPQQPVQGQTQVQQPGYPYYPNQYVPYQNPFPNKSSQDDIFEKNKEHPPG